MPPGSVTDRRRAQQLVGRVLLQLFPECAVQPTTPYRGRVAELLPASNAAEWKGQIWLKVIYEDGDDAE